MSKLFLVIAAFLLILVAGVLFRYGPSILHPHGDSENAIWAKIVSSPEITGPEGADCEVLHWNRNFIVGDQSPVQKVVVRCQGNVYEIEATAWVYVGEDWDAEILSIREL